ncbi:MAG: hypothetical protein OHK0021_22840 [Bryobacter sp.]
MLGKTSLSATRALLVLAQEAPEAVVSPRRLAEMLGESPTYLAKVMRQLGKAAIVEAEMGAKGGVRLLRSPEEVTLLAIVEACQGAILPDYCRSAQPGLGVCGFHWAAAELHLAILGVLERWTLRDLLAKPTEVGAGGMTCLMAKALKLPTLYFPAPQKLP